MTDNIEDDPPTGVRVAPAARDPLGHFVKDALDGDARATRALLEQLMPTVLRAVRGVLGRAHPDVEDATQMVLVAIVRALASFRGECQVKHFAARIATRIAMDQRAQSQTRSKRVTPLDGGTVAEPGGHDERAASDRERVLWQLLQDALPAAQAETMILRVMLEYTLEETASALGIPVNTVRSRLRLAREALRKKIERDPALAEQFVENP